MNFILRFSVREVLVAVLRELVQLIQVLFSPQGGLVERQRVQLHL